MQTKDEVEDITVRIRSRLIEGGQLGKSARITQLKAKTIKGAQCRDINNIEIGDGIKPTKDYKKRNLKKARLYTVLDKTRDRLTLVDKEGTKYTVDPIFEKTVYTQIPLQIAEGDRLFWTRRDSQLQHKKGQEFKVKWIRENTAKIEYYDGKIEQINLNTPLHLDFGWVKPNYRSRGNDEKILMFVGALDKDNFYKALSGTKYQLKFYMDNVQEFLEVVSLEQENPLADKREELAAQRRETNFKEKIIKNSVVKVYNETRDLIKLSDSSQEIVKDTDSKKEKNTIETQSNKPEKSNTNSL